MDAARPRTLPAAVAPVLVGSALARAEGRFDPAAAGLCLAFALLVQVGTNFANDYFDFRKGADTAARVGPVRAVAAGLVTPAAMLRATVLVLALAFAVGLGLIPWGGTRLLVVGIASIVCAVAYTGGPLPLAYTGLGDLFVFLFFGLVAVCTTYAVQAGHLSARALAAAVPVGLLASNILVVNNYRDMETDAMAGKRTLVVRFGRRAARVQFTLCLAGAMATAVGLALHGRHWGCLLPLALLPLAARHIRRLRESDTPAERVALLGATGRFLFLYAGLLSAGLLAG